PRALPPPRRSGRGRTGGRPRDLRGGDAQAPATVKLAVRILRRAQRDLVDIDRYLSRDEPARAGAVVDRLLQAIDSLSTQAERRTIAIAPSLTPRELQDPGRLNRVTFHTLQRVGDVLAEKLRRDLLIAIELGSRVGPDDLQGAGAVFVAVDGEPGRHHRRATASRGPAVRGGDLLRPVACPDRQRQRFGSH